MRERERGNPSQDFILVTKQDTPYVTHRIHSRDNQNRVFCVVAARVLRKSRVAVALAQLPWWFLTGEPDSPVNR